MLSMWECMALSGSCYIDGAGQEYGLFQSNLFSCGHRTPKNKDEAWLGMAFFLPYTLFISLFYLTALSLSNITQEQPTCWASNGNYTDSHLSNLSFAGLFETRSTIWAFNTLGTTKFEVSLRDGCTD